MDYKTNIPIYVQIATDIKEQIMSGKLKDGSKLSSIREYSLIYEISALTAQRALQQLELEGDIQTKKGIGSFVVCGCRANIETQMVGILVHEFVAHMKKMGLNNQSIQNAVEEDLKNE